MRPLAADDPEDIGGHRLLTRLGAGGMGVVYLARTGGGALVALKTIHAQHAADPAFRTRFRREVTAVRGLTGRWLVPVVAADAEAREPWLATEFVPGPSLVEAVDGFGVLPVAAVRTLGSRLAEALTAVHDAGLVHRDVKPGNVLLALDGPRLIDFGIAYAGGATVLTAPDAVVGTPGFLAPEQARARAGEVGPASDVFSLGCVLAYAASGRRPFGGGNAAGVLFRTVHEEPDLAEVPGELETLIRACLAKDPAERPTVREVAATLDDPRVSLARNISGGRDEGWLPTALLRVVAERSARALDVPTPRRAIRPETGDDAPGAGDSTSSGPQDARPPTRRRVLLMGGAAASVVAVGGGVTAYLTAGRGSDGGAGGSRGSGGGLPVHTLGFQADLSGSDKAGGVAQERGARLAVEQHNKRAGITFRLALNTVDDRGDAAGGDEAARGLTEAGVSAVLGLGKAASALAAAPVYEEARTAMVLISADGAELTGSEPDLSTVRVTRGPESTLAVPLVSYLSSLPKVDRTAVIDDLEAGQTGSDLTTLVRRSPPGGGETSVHSVEADSNDFAAAVRDALAAKAQAVVFSGTSPERAARCARALAEAGFTGPRVGIWHSMGPAFLQQAGTVGRGWVFAAPFTDPDSVSGTFRAAYRKKYGTGPGRWSPEAYDAVGLLARTLRNLGGTADIEPGAVAQRLFDAEYGAYKGIAKTLRFTTDGTNALKAEEPVYSLFQAEEQGFRLLDR